MGTILLTNLVSNPHFRYAGLIAEDHTTLAHFVDGLLAVQDVVYAVVTKSDGTVLFQRTKGFRRTPESLVRSDTQPLYPNPQIIQPLLHSKTEAPQLRELSMLTPVSSRFAWEEHIYDLAMSVSISDTSHALFEALTLQKEEHRVTSSLQSNSGAAAVVQLGLSDARLKKELVSSVTHATLITLLIISTGIVGAHLLTRRIITPLRNLAAVTREVAEGKSPSPLPTVSTDEVGQLTYLFNQMTTALRERNAAIGANMDTIRRQINQLETVHQTSATIRGTLNIEILLDTVLQSLMANLGFTQMVLMLRHKDQEVAYVAHTEGVTEEIAEAARYLTFPINDDETIISQLFIQAQPLLVADIRDVAHRMNPSILELALRAGVRSFVCVPLVTPAHVVGFIAGNRSSQPCTEEDLDILITIASQIATAIDNARAYADLEQLTRDLEYRVEERTRELSEANNRLKEHDQKRSVFFSVASHELRTPMTAIRSFADNMLDGVAGPLTDRQTTYLKRIEHNLNRLTRIINQLLDWSRLDLKKESLRLEPLCVGQIANLVVENLAPVATEKGVTICLEIPNQLPPTHADRDKLEQIFWNLIGNAVKFTPTGGTVTVTVSVTPDHQIQIRVSDTGCGISQENLHRIFDEFSKVPSPVPTAQGAQLGLFITKTLVEMHGGTIIVESALNEGTTFTVTMPCGDSVQSSPEGTFPTDSPEGAART